MHMKVLLNMIRYEPSCSSMHNISLKIQAYRCAEEQVFFASVFHVGSVLQDVPLRLHTHCRSQTHIKMAFMCATSVCVCLSLRCVKESLCVSD